MSSASNNETTTTNNLGCENAVAKLKEDEKKIQVVSW